MSEPWRSGVGAAGRAALTLMTAAALVAVATGARLALAPQLGLHSPFMLYIAAVLVAGLVRGPACGGLVMLGGGIAGARLFLAPHGVLLPGSMADLMLFWAVSAAVLLTANELRVQLGEAMSRLSEALARRVA